MKSSDQLQTLQAMGDLQSYIDGGYTLMDLIASGVFSRYGLGNIFNKTYGPYSIGCGATITCEHEDDPHFQRIVQVSYENDNGERIVEPNYNYAISMTPTSTAVLKVKSSTGINVMKTYITVMFRKSRTKFDGKESGVLIYNDAYILNNPLSLKGLKPEYGITNAYVAQQNLSYKFVNGEWEPVLDISSTPDNPTVIDPGKAADINYNRLCHVEYYRKELVGAGHSLVLAFPPVAYLANVFALVSQFDEEITKTHFDQYECHKFLDRFIVTNKHARMMMFDVRLWVGYPNEATANAYYKELTRYVVDTEVLSLTQEPHAKTSIGGLIIDTTKLGQ
jgi:hypothetical protein